MAVVHDSTEIGYETRLRLTWKHYEMHERIYDLDSFVYTDKLHASGEVALGFAPAGDIARVLAEFYRDLPHCVEELAAAAYLAAIPPNRIVVVKQG